MDPLKKTTCTLTHDGTPEGVLDADFGVVCQDLSSLAVYRKTTGAGVLTGWEKLVGWGSNVPQAESLIVTVADDDARDALTNVPVGQVILRLDTKGFERLTALAVGETPATWESVGGGGDLPTDPEFDSVSAPTITATATYDDDAHTFTPGTLILEADLSYSVALRSTVQGALEIINPADSSPAKVIGNFAFPQYTSDTLPNIFDASTLTIVEVTDVTSAGGAPTTLYRGNAYAGWFQLVDAAIVP